MDRKVFKYLRIWGLPVVFFAGVLASVLFWVDLKLSVPGSFKDLLYLEQVLSEAASVGDVALLSDYVRFRTAEILVAPARDSEGLLLFSYIEHVLNRSDLTRNLSDLKYAVAVYKKELLVSSPAFFRMYLWVWAHSKYFIKVSIGNRLISNDAACMAKLVGMRQKNQSEPKDYEALLSLSSFSNFKAAIMLKLAYLTFDKDPEISRKWLQQCRRNKPSSAVQFAADALIKKMSKRNQRLNSKDFDVESQVVRLLQIGDFAKAKSELMSKKEQIDSIKLQEIKGWLGIESDAEKQEKLPFFSIYFQTLNQNVNHPIDTADKLAKLAENEDWSIYRAILRYQAWGISFFDGHSFSRAILFKEFLKSNDPLSLYSQLESMGGLLSFSKVEYRGAELEAFWKKMPYLFDKKRTDDWEGFKGGKGRRARTTVYEGHVFVADYDFAGEAVKLYEVGSNQTTPSMEKVAVGSSKVIVAKSQSETMGWLEQYLYDFMVKFVPLGVLTFKRELSLFAKRLKDDVFTRTYSESEFQFYVINKMQKKLGDNIKNLTMQITPEGFSGVGIIDFKIFSVPVSGLGKILANEDGGLILELDHVKVGMVYVPQWILRNVESSFSRSAGTENAGASYLDILNIQYESQRALIKCRKKGN